MDIQITHRPPDNIPQIRRKYRRASLLCLGVVACSLIMGAVTVLSDAGDGPFLEYTAFGLFVASGFMFVYVTEKLMGYRRLGLKQKKDLLALRGQYDEVEQYCRQVASQGRYVVVNEFEAIAAHVERINRNGPKPEAG